jgi:hypothetical protein
MFAHGVLSLSQGVGYRPRSPIPTSRGDARPVRRQAPRVPDAQRWPALVQTSPTSSNGAALAALPPILGGHSLGGRLGKDAVLLLGQFLAVVGEVHFVE